MSYWQNKTVLVTGGSAGLGLHLARAWGKSGASVILVARNRERLEEAANQLTSEGIEARTRQADVTSPDDVKALADWVTTQVGSLDVLANSAGRSARGKIMETSPDEFESMWRLNFLATVSMTQTLLPLIQKSHGHIVNIGSLASKTAAPFLGPYPSSKFPLAAFSQQLRLELKLESATPPHVLLVCPGPIARNDAGTRYDDQSEGLPDSARNPGGGARLKAIDPTKLSAKILRACERRQFELIIPSMSRVQFMLQALVPKWGDWLLLRSTGTK